jgi:hypothetical protein
MQIADGGGSRKPGANQGDQMSLWKKAPKMQPSPFFGQHYYITWKK